ncbi:MAG: RNA-binding protein [Chthoniobacterales bacterium]|nr:RNA-binding protein [Chthoniobacterales bacterium]
MRNPELCEVTSPRLYVGNLPYAATESDLFELFKGVGIVKNVEIIWDKRNQSRGFGFVEMQSLEEAKRAVEQLHDKEYMGRKLVVSGAKALAEDRASQRKAGRTPSAPAETPAPSATGEIPETAQAQPTSPSAPPSQTTSSPSESSEAEPRRSAA